MADIKTERVLSLTTPTGFRSPGGGRPPVNTTRAERASGPAVRMGVRKWPARRHPLRLQRAEAPSQPDGHPIHFESHRHVMKRGVKHSDGGALPTDFTHAQEGNWEDMRTNEE